MKQDEKRVYNMSDSELCMLVSNLVVYMTRDAVEFTAKNVSPTATTAFEALGNAFEVFPADAYYQADVMIATQAKDSLRSSCELKLRDIVGLAKLKWGSSSPQVLRFQAGQMTKSADKAFLTTCRMGVTVATDYLTDLAAYGLTQLMIDALEDEAQAFEDSLNAQSLAMYTRDTKARERVEKGNELYGYVSLYCETGKIIWDDVDLAKYENYVIYSQLPGVPFKIQNMLFTSSTNTISWDTELSADSYELQYAPNSPTPAWLQIYAGTATEYRHDGVTGICLYRCRGVNENGYGYWSDVLVVPR